MKKSIPVQQKRRGRPATGQTPPFTMRLPKDLAEAIDKWAARNDIAARSEAIRRLVEQALATAPKLPVKSKARDVARVRAEKIALEQIDRLLENTDQPEDEKAERKRRLIKGPVELRKRPAS